MSWVKAIERGSSPPRGFRWRFKVEQTNIKKFQQYYCVERQPRSYPATTEMDQATANKQMAISNRHSLLLEEVAMNGPSETKDLLFRALEEAVVRIWSNLPQTVQQHLFEEAIMSHGESMRQQLAVFLHDKHSRTSDSIKAHAMPEPDSLGG